MVWRWDQGRLIYFQYDEIKRIAKALCAFDGQVLPKSGELDSLRTILSQYVDLPFFPLNYTVWRNYKRVFACQLLGTEINKIFYSTELCKKIANDEIEADEYFSFIARKFYFSSPIFEGYKVTDKKIFPFSVIIKFLCAQYILNGSTILSLEEIESLIIANGLFGTEEYQEYINLSPKSASVDRRQLRELVIFISQLSFLKWLNGKLVLDIDASEQAYDLFNFFTPIDFISNSNPALEILQLGSLGQSDIKTIVNLNKTTPIELDQEFVEGKKVRVTHLRIERSSKLRDFFYSSNKFAHICDMCAMDTNKRYSWTDRVIELHHLLPLSSPIRVEKKSTSLDDIVGVCPTCHRATHKFYSKYLKNNKIGDFRSYDEARHVYNEAKSLVML